MKVAIVQMRVEMGAREANLARALEAIAEAAGAGADLVVLPECPFIGWLSERVADLAEPIPGAITHKLADAAKEHGIYLCSGLTEHAGDDFFNSAVLFDRMGRLLLRHRKINELDVGLEIYSRGQQLSVADTEFDLLGVNICADNWLPCIDQTLALMGARIVVSPCAWACDPGDEIPNIQSIRAKLKERTTESEIYLVCANSVGQLTEGPWKGRILQGASLAYAPGGSELLAGPMNQEAILYCEIPA